jgi:hypothetical protein
LDEEITGLDKALDGRGADFLLFERSVVLELETFQDPRIKRLEDIASTMKDPPESPRGLSRDQRMAKFNELVVPHLRQYYRTLR